MSEPSKSLAEIVAELRELEKRYAEAVEALDRARTYEEYSSAGDCYSRAKGAFHWEINRHHAALLGAAERAEKAEARVRELEAALERLKAVEESSNSRAVYAEARKRELEQALLDYGEHDPRCAIRQPNYPPCTCGLDAVIRGEGE